VLIRYKIPSIAYQIKNIPFFKNENENTNTQCIKNRKSISNLIKKNHVVKNKYMVINVMKEI